MDRLGVARGTSSLSIRAPRRLEVPAFRLSAGELPNTNSLPRQIIVSQFEYVVPWVVVNLFSSS